MPKRALSLVLAVFSLSAFAAPLDPKLFQELHWRSIGPYRGGRVLAVAGVPGEREHFYFGAVNGGVWETNDAGRTWKPVFDEQPIGSIGALAIAASSPKTIYAGTGEADMRSDISQGDGVYKSTDGGKTWTNVGLRDSQQIGRIVVDPKDGNRVFVAALGHPYGPNAERGLFRSTDGGRAWKRVLGKDENTGAIDVAFEPGDARVVYAALWRTRRPPWNVYPPSNGPGSGLYKSTDGGDTWQLLAGGFPENPGRIGIAIAPSQPARVYAMVDAEKGGLYRSDDAGATWARVSSDERVWGRGWYFAGLAVEPRDADVVYSCNTSLHRSTDGGKTFAPIKGAPGGDDYHELFIDAADPARRMLGVDQGAVVSLNGGATWSSWYNQPTAQFYRLATDTRFPYWVYGSQQDSGAAAVPSRTTTTRDGISLMQFHEITAGGENDSIAPDPKDPDVIYGGRVDRLDLKTYQTASLDPTIAFPDHHRSEWTLPLVFSPRDPRVLYFANQRVFRTENGGKSWSAISPDLTREAPGVPANLDAPTAKDDGGVGPRRGVVQSIAPSRSRDREIWAGTDDGKLWKTRDEGATWSDVTPKALTPWSKVTMVETSRFEPDTAYAAVDRHRLDDFAPYLYRTRDGGKSWTLVVSGIPRDRFLNAIREDTARKGLLYAGTEKGMFVSFDDGDSWQPLQLDLPVTSVRDIDVHGNDVVIATHGRGFYILDDVSSLREASAEVGAAAAFLFTPARAVRVRPAGFTGTPLPKDEPMSPNPPLGAVIDYTLLSEPKELSLTILDEAGAVVRRYRGDDKLPGLKSREKVLAPEWLAPPRPLPATPGMHRFVWPIRYAAVPALARGDAFADGVWAPPGLYTVELFVDGRRLTKPLVVEPDPRVALDDAAYRRQFELARKIEAARADLATATKEAEGHHKKLSSRAHDPAAAALDARLLALAEFEDTSVRTMYPPPKSLTSFRFLENALDKLQTVVDGADADPSPDAVTGFAKISATLEKSLSEWSTLKEEASRRYHP